VVLFGILKLSELKPSGLNKSVRNVKKENRDDGFNKNKEKVTQRTGESKRKQGKDSNINAVTNRLQEPRWLSQYEYVMG
jgi:hypothetical protein